MKAYITFLLIFSLTVRLHGSSTSDRELWKAAQLGDSTTLSSLLAQGADPNYELGGLTPLHFAARQGCSDTVATLLQAGAHPDGKRTGLQKIGTISSWLIRQIANTTWAQWTDWKDEVDYWDRNNDNFTPLGEAVKEGAFDCFRLLLRAGASIERACGTKCDILGMAASKHHNNFIRTLLLMGFDPNGKQPAEWLGWNDYQVPLRAAVRANNVEGVELLLKAGADVDYDNGCPLVEAAARGYDQICQLLLSYRVNPNTFCNGASVFEHAIRSNQSNDSTIFCLLKHGAHYWSARDLRHDALRRGYVNVLQFLLERGVNFDHSSTSRCMLEVASDSGQKAVVELLLSTGIKPECDNCCPLTTAISRKYHEIVAVLLKAGAKTNHAPQSPDASLWSIFGRYTPLEVAVKEHNVQATKMLRQVGVRGKEPEASLRGLLTFVSH